MLFKSIIIIIIIIIINACPQVGKFYRQFKGMVQHWLSSGKKLRTLIDVQNVHNKLHELTVVSKKIVKMQFRFFILIWTMYIYMYM